MQASLGGDERAETYLRLMAEREFRRVIQRPANSPGEADFRLRLVPPQAATQDAIELLATGGSAQIRAVVPVRGAPAMPDN